MKKLKLIIKQFSGPEIAHVTQSDSGELQVTALFPELLPELETLIHKYEGQTLKLTGGGPEQLPDGTMVEQTVVYKIPPEDPRYLRALGDTLQNEHDMVQGKRLHCWTEEE